MKKVQMFMTDWCPHCNRALRLIEEAIVLNPQYAKIEIEKINEEKNVEYANQFDYYYIPTFYVDGKKIHEGSISIEDVIRVCEEASK